MGNCCCVLRNGDKKFKSSQKPGHKRTYYKYGDDEYDNDDYDQETLDYDRQTTKSDLSSQVRPKYEQKRPRANRLLDKAIMNQHQLNNPQLTSSSSSTILLLKQSHLVQPSNLEKKFNSDLVSKMCDLKQKSQTALLNHSDSYNLALNKIKSVSSLGSRSKRWSIISSDLIDSLSARENEDNAKPLLSELSDVDDGVDMGDDALDNVSDSNNPDSIKDGLTDNNSSSDQLIVNSISSTVITTSKSSYADATPKLIQSCHSMKSSTEDLTSNSNLDDYEPNRRRLLFQKRSPNLNHSLNESDLIINGRVGKKRKLKQRKIDLADDPLNKSYHEDDDYNSDDMQANKLKKNYVNYRSLQKSKRSIKSIEQTIKSSKSIEKWLNDFDKIAELESPPATIPRCESTAPNDELYSLVPDAQDLSKKATDSVGKNLHDCILAQIELNSKHRVRGQENEMFNFIQKFVFPKSLANADDINYLKHILSDNNFCLFSQQPGLSHHSSSFILQCQNINVNLVESCAESDNDMEDQLYIKYVNDKQILLLDQQKVKYMLKKEKELSQATNLNNQGVLESFRQKYIETSNFRVVQSLLDICKKSHCSRAMSNSSSSSTSSTPTMNASGSESSPIPIHFSDLNDKLFLCFLSNFSCKLVENFLHTTNNLNQSQLNLSSAGFIRKHKRDHSFSYVINESHFKSSNFKLYLKLSQWPRSYDFLSRLKFIKCQRLLHYIATSTCLITNKSSRDELDMSYDEAGAEKWTVDTRLAETVLFKSLSTHQLFIYFYLFNVLNSLQSIMHHACAIVAKQGHERFVGPRVLLHHFLRFIDSHWQSMKLEPHRVLLSFSSFLRASIHSCGSLNRPNFFDLEQEIVDEAGVDGKLSEFVDLLAKSEPYFRKASKPIDLSVHCELVSPQSSSKIFHQYLSDFFQILFDQFKSKRDHFKMNEQVLVDIHDKVLTRNENLGSLLANQQAHIDISAALLSKFEFYAECVHKYLPQIRQHNQYLLFHYIWTMQVQYLAPFFNYICDLYKSYN